MDIKITVGKRVRELRIKGNITQQALADATGLDRTFISHIERGDRNIGVETLERLIIGLGVSLKAFFNNNCFNN